MLNPDTARLSDGALFQLKNHKVEHCVRQLTGMDLELHEAQDAAKLMGGDVDNAVEWHMDSTRFCLVFGTLQVNTLCCYLGLLKTPWTGPR